MGWRVIDQGDGFYGIFSTTIDNIIYAYCTKGTVIDLFAERAERIARADMQNRFRYRNTPFMDLESALNKIKTVHGQKEYEDALQWLNEE